MDNTICWIFSDTIQEKFDEGWIAWEVFATSKWVNKTPNPYAPKTNNWYSWNKGWNLNDKGISDLNS